MLQVETSDTIFKCSTTDLECGALEQFNMLGYIAESFFKFVAVEITRNT